MKRTISEVIDLIKQKKESAENERDLLFDAIDEAILNSTIDAYTDVLCLLESSHLVEQEKALEILKDKINIIGNDNLNYYQLSLKPDKCVGDTADIMLITKEEHKVLKEVLNEKNI